MVRLTAHSAKAAWAVSNGATTTERVSTFDFGRTVPAHPLVVDLLDFSLLGRGERERVAEVVFWSGRFGVWFGGRLGWG